MAHSDVFTDRQAITAAAEGARAAIDAERWLRTWDSQPQPAPAAGADGEGDGGGDGDGGGGGDGGGDGKGEVAARRRAVGGAVAAPGAKRTRPPARLAAGEPTLPAQLMTQLIQPTYSWARA